MPKLSIDRNFELRSVSKLWKHAIDTNDTYWKAKQRIVAPSVFYSTPRDACSFFTLHGITPRHLYAVHRLFGSSSDDLRYLARMIVAHFLKQPAIGTLRIVPHGNGVVRHPAAQDDPFSFSVVYTNPAAQHPDRTFTFFFCNGQGILWKRGSGAWNLVRVTDFTQAYRAFINGV